MSRLLFLIMEKNTTITERKEAFLKVYPTAGTISAAAKAIGVHRTRPTQWLKDDPIFAKKFEDARQGFVETLEDIALGLVKEMSDKRDYKANPTLLIFMLNGNAPEKYKGISDASDGAKDLLAEFRKAASTLEKESKEEKAERNTRAKRPYSNMKKRKKL